MAEDNQLGGRTLGQFEIRNLIGAGGMGSVYRAYQPNLDRYVALKVILPDLVKRPDILERFKLEARTIARLEHPNIVTIYDANTIDGFTYVAMRLLTGGTLQGRFQQRERQRKSQQGIAATLVDMPAPKEIVDVLRQLASALDYAHANGVIHRDIKPSNVMFDNDNNAFLVDFGIARLLDSAATRLTKTGLAVGTATYMAPEVFRDDEPTGAVDQYAMGIMAYALLTEHAPYEASSMAAIMLKHVEAPIPSVTATHPEYGEAVDTVFQKVLAKFPQDRYASCAEFVDALDEALSVPTLSHRYAMMSGFFDAPSTQQKLLEPTPSAQVVRGTAMPPPSTGPISQSTGVRPTSSGMNRIAIGLGIVAILLIGGVLGTAFLQSRQEPPSGLFVELGFVPTWTPSPTATNTPTVTPSATSTATSTATETATSTPTPSSTATPSATATETLTFTFTPTATFTPAIPQLTIGRNGVPVRQGPSNAYPIIESLQAGDVFEIQGVSESSDWYQIRLGDGSLGWVANTSSIELAGNVIAVAIAIPPTETPSITPTPSSTATTTPTPTSTLPPTATSGPTQLPTPVIATQAASGNGISPIPYNLVSVSWSNTPSTRISSSAVPVPAGCFTMGSSEQAVDTALAQCQQESDGACTRDMFEKESPASQICFDETFWIDRTEVTNGSYGSSGQFSGNLTPRVDISWAEASAYCASVGGRLPTEAEWEYAARGPEDNIYPWGNTFSDNRAVYAGNSGDQPQNVGQYPLGVSWVGAYDMAGNVREWTSSIYRDGDYPYNASDGRENLNDTASERVVRGGSWMTIPVSLRTADRVGENPTLTDWNIGFRCVYDQPPASAIEVAVINVDATLLRNDTGITVQPGDQVYVEAISGQWRAGTVTVWPNSGATGDPQARGNPAYHVPNANVMTLVGGLGTRSPFAIGERYSFVSQTTDRLWLAANDDGFADNAGSLRVKVVVVRNGNMLTQEPQVLYLENESEATVDVWRAPGSNQTDSYASGTQVVLYDPSAVLYSGRMWYLVKVGSTSSGSWGWVDTRSLSESPVDQVIQCPGAPDSQIRVGNIIERTTNDSLNVRSGPSTRSQTSSQLRPGQQRTVTAGPVCSDNYAWWLIGLDQNSPSTAYGWVAEGDNREYFIHPVNDDRAVTDGVVEMGYQEVISMDRIQTGFAEQAFQRGWMFWFEDTDRIYALYQDGDEQKWRPLNDIWIEGQALSPLSAPSGLVAPVRGFGALYRAESDLPGLLGWGLRAEVGGTVTREQYELEDQTGLRSELIVIHGLSQSFNLFPDGTWAQN
ncbi:MAG: SUMF1/EgtB/PvdO family nonheme iron enzyme [Anaerolineae bacterium]|nr:SUMF1/EgtB/PvdO family nonheme iron enzyme [Anaerolineae bacterium]